MDVTFDPDTLKWLNQGVECYLAGLVTAGEITEEQRIAWTSKYLL